MSILQKYYRQPTMFVPLPSNFYFYDEDSFDYDEEISSMGEVGVMPLTTMNELTLKNPEALINGEAICQVIRDCTTLKVNAKNLIKADVDALLVGIKIATENSYYHNVTLTCQNDECKHEFVHSRNLDNIIQNIQKHDKEYTLNVADGNLTLYLRPSYYKEHLQYEDHAFNEQKEIEQIEKRLKQLQESGEEVDDNEKLKFFGLISETFKNVTTETMELYANNIMKIVDNNANEGEESEETNKDMILEWLQQLDKKTFELIQAKIQEINYKGLDDTEEVECPECEHKWVQQFNINHSDFFANGS